MPAVAGLDTIGHGSTWVTVVADLIARLTQIPTFRLILYMWAASLLAAAVMGAIAIALLELGVLDEDAMGMELIESMSFASLFVMIVIVSPVVETLLCQLALLMLVRVITRNIARSESWLPALLVTSLMFAALHAGNAVNALTVEGLAHVMFRVPVAFLFTLLAVVERHREVGYPVLGVMLLHSLYNLPLALSFAFWPVGN